MGSIGSAPAAAATQAVPALSRGILFAFVTVTCRDVSSHLESGGWGNAMTRLPRLCALAVISVAFTSAVRGTPVAGQSARVWQLMEGEELFRSYCAVCHGEDGKGHGPAAPALKTLPADLTAIATRNAGTFPSDRVARFVANGEPAITAHGSREMPIWGPNFLALAPGSFKPINERVDAVVAYLQSIQTEK